MSTYLVAIAVGDLDYLSSTVNNVTVSIYEIYINI
jgi:aminopeptidase N